MHGNLQHAIGAAGGPTACPELVEALLESTIVTSMLPGASDARRGSLGWLIGAMASFCGKRVYQVKVLEHIMNLGYLAREPGRQREIHLSGWPVTKFRITGGKVHDTVTVAHVRQSLTGKEGKLFFAGEDEPQYLLVEGAPLDHPFASITVYEDWKYRGEPDHIDAIMAEIPRAPFMPPDVQDEARNNIAVPIGNGQATISQPETVAFMLRLLGPLEGRKVLDVGSGSAYTTVLLSRLVGTGGVVVATEVDPDLYRAGKAMVARYPGGAKVLFRQAYKGYVLGDPKAGPYDRILVSAGARCVPFELIDQLADGGIMVIPVQGVMCVITKRADGQLDLACYAGFKFVPLV